jgi:hypothetical protein
MATFDAIVGSIIAARANAAMVFLKGFMGVFPFGLFGLWWFADALLQV